MYEKYLTLVLLVMASGSMIGASIQFYNENQYVFAQTNQSPEADDQDVSVDANDNIKITLKGNDDDKDDEIEFEIVSDPSHGELDNFDKSDGTVSYTPEKDYSGEDKFEFKVMDNKGAESDKAEIKINVKPLEKANEEVGGEMNQESQNQTESSSESNESISTNQSPIAHDQELSTDANADLDITLIGEDTDNDPIQFEIVSSPADATLNNFDSAKGTVTYSPEMNYTGNDSFSFKVVDDRGFESNNAIVSVDVTENNQTNQAPQAFDQVTSEANLSNYRYAVWSAGEEEDRYIFFSRSTDGGKTFSTPLSLSGKSRTPVFNPEVSSSGNNIYVVWQGQSENGNQDIFMRKSVDYGSSFSGVENLSNDPGGSGNPQVTINGNTTHVAWEGTTPGNNYIFYSKSDNGSKFDLPQKIGDSKGIPYSPELIVKDNPVTDSFTFKAVDDNGAESNVATVEVNAEAVNQNTVNDETKSISIDSSQEMDITLKAKDLNKDPVQFEIVTAPTQGHLDKFDPNSGKVTYVPDEDNKIDIQWHNYQNGQDRILSQVVDNGEEGNEDDNSGQKQSNDPFKAKQ
jgi:hypothetical protein